MNILNDPMGKAIADYHKNKKANKLRVLSPMFDEDEMPVSHLFRTYTQMPKLERRALDLAKGRVLDVGAGAGCHSLVLQQRGLDVTAIDISPLSVQTMQQRGIANAIEKNFFDVDNQYDTILMLMNGIGIVGSLKRLPDLFHHLDNVLAPDGQLLCDSTDICYLFEDEDGVIELPEGDYYGEQTFHMQYGDVVGEPFPWLYVDADTLQLVASQCGYKVEIVLQGKHYDYLARITR